MFYFIGIYNLGVYIAARLVFARGVGAAAHVVRVGGETEEAGAEGHRAEGEVGLVTRGAGGTRDAADVAGGVGVVVGLVADAVGRA